VLGKLKTKHPQNRLPEVYWLLISACFFYVFSKTTTINMLTGALAPTEGYATVAGKDIRTQTQQIREDIGICLQHDCLFPQLTVREHVQFFSRVKGLYKEMSREAAEEHIDQVIQDVALSEKRNTMSRNLSGGMKRKLSVAIAFCGGSKIVLLDEPTSGMVRLTARLLANCWTFCVFQTPTDALFYLFHRIRSLGGLHGT
jgi:ABC-type multidrug transport system ATPase subunit